MEKLTPAQVELKVANTGDLLVKTPVGVCFHAVACVCLLLQTAEVVQFILVKDQKKIPIRRAGSAAAGCAGPLVLVPPVFV